MASAGGSVRLKKTSAPQTNMTRKMSMGMTDQDVSRRVDPRMRGVFTRPVPRRYFTAKKKIEAEIARAARPVTTSRNRKSLSTWSAVVEACFGSRDSCASMAWFQPVDRHSPKPDKLPKYTETSEVFVQTRLPGLR